MAVEFSRELVEAPPPPLPNGGRIPLPPIEIRDPALSLLSSLFPSCELPPEVEVLLPPPKLKEPPTTPSFPCFPEEKEEEEEEEEGW